MSFKDNLCPCKEQIKKYAQENKDAKVVFKDGNKYIGIDEFICYVTHIAYGSDGDSLEIRLADGITANVGKLYTNKKIKEGDIISIVGYFFENSYGLQFRACGGGNKIITNARELGAFNVIQTHRMGIVLGLSKLEIPKIYSSEIEPQLVQIEDTNFFYLLKDIEVFELDDESIDVRYYTTVNTNIDINESANVSK